MMKNGHAIDDKQRKMAVGLEEEEELKTKPRKKSEEGRTTKGKNGMMVVAILVISVLPFLVFPPSVLKQIMILPPATIHTAYNATETARTFDSSPFQTKANSTPAAPAETDRAQETTSPEESPRQDLSTIATNYTTKITAINITSPQESQTPKKRFKRGVDRTEIDVERHSKYLKYLPKRQTLPEQQQQTSTSRYASSPGKTKIAAFVTDSYVEVAKTWYKRLYALGYTNHVIVCTDNNSFQQLENYTFSSPQNENVVVPIQVELSLKPEFPEIYRNVRFGQKMRHGVMMLFAHRWVYLLEQLQLGNNVLLTDVDNLFNSFHPTSLLDQSDHDVYFALETRHPGDVYDLQGFVVCGGMGWYRASPPTITMIQEQVNLCGIECDDQVVFNRMIYRLLDMQWSVKVTATEQLKASEATNQDENNDVHAVRLSGLWEDGFQGISRLEFRGDNNSTTDDASFFMSVGVWNRTFVYRGSNTPKDCPHPNWVSMPFVIYKSRWQGPAAKVKSFAIWDEACPRQPIEQIQSS